MAQNKIIKAGVIGDPISHSLSPVIHNFFLEKYEISGSYEAVHIKKDNLGPGVQGLVDQGFSGFNVTIPHKESIFKICDHTSKSAQLVGAVNTVIITADNKLFGHNSDVDGFLNNLRNLQPDFDLNDKTAFVIGAGGASRAIVYGLIKSGVRKIHLTNRNKERALNLIANFSSFETEIEFLEMAEFSQNLNSCDLLVNTTSLGMLHGTKVQEELIIDLSLLNDSAIVYDIVYKPLMTNLLKNSEERGNKIVTGIGMLIEQALIGFEAWFKEKPKPDSNLEKKLTNL
jgi:shikimate dehydrogenase